METTAAHQNIFSAVQNKAGNITVSAVAGSGKTTTIFRCLKLVAPTEGVLFLAFNKPIAEELSARAKRDGCNNVTVKTLNGLGHVVWCLSRGGFNKVTLKEDKVQTLVNTFVHDTSLHAVVTKLVKLAKAAGMIPAGIPGTRAGVIDASDASFTKLAAHHDIDLSDGEPVVIFDLARTVLRENIKTLNVIDFDDQLLLPFAYGISGRRYDRVFVDEAQDLSPLQHELVAAALKKDGQLVAVGDECQAIYGFRGADANSMKTLISRFNMTALPLHVSYRCPKKVVELAQKYVGHIQAHASAPEGSTDLRDRDFRDVVTEMKGGDMVTSRFNAPLAKIAMALLRERIPCVIRGRDIGVGLKSLVKKLRASDVPTFLKRLDAWESREVAALNDKPELAANVADKAATLRVFCEGCLTTTEVVAAIDRMFSDMNPNNVVLLTSIHRAKGLEANKVYAVNFGAMPGKAKTPWQAEQEKNLIYVQVTRAKDTLVTISVPRNAAT